MQINRCRSRRSAILAPALILLAAIASGEVYATTELRVPEAQPAAPAFSSPLRQRLDAALTARGPHYEARSRHRRPDGSPLFTNRLLLEQSPYLQQHAHNPVNWYPWGPEAFAEARRLGRPILVSIGYSTCHWCHVMEEESFDSIETAKVMNAAFIAIKVDREVRPDIDGIYMAAANAMGEPGGWPLNVFVTADGKPFFAGTYFPPTDRGGRPGFVHVLNQISAAYVEEQVEIQANAEILAAHLRAQLEGRAVIPSEEPGEEELAQLIAEYMRAADREWGGIGKRTKFPSSLPIGLLLREWRRTGNAKALGLARLSLDRMAAGGIHDQLGGGFHRYATDRQWLVPHFEKMLYDNALIAVAYLEAFQATAEPAYERVVRDVLDYVLRDMTDAKGGFYSATDADSRGPEGESEEGYFFTWTRSEVEVVLGQSEARIPIAWYGIVEPGPQAGRNVLHTFRDRNEVAAELGLSPAVFDLKLGAGRERLLAARALRTPPLRDEKILVAWNGLMISALARAGFALDEPRYVDAASRAARTLLVSMLRDGRLSRVSLAGEIGGPAFLEDHAFLIAGLIDLYEATGESRWIASALSLQAIQEQFYSDPNPASASGGYFQTASDGEVLLAREKPIGDGAVPSGNSVAASNLSRLATLTGDHVYRQRWLLLHSAMAQELGKSMFGSATLMETVSDRVSGIREIVVVEAAEGGDASPMLAPLRKEFAPARVVILTREGPPLDALAKILPIVAGKNAIARKTTAYVCENRVCQFPTNDPRVFEAQLKERPKTTSKLIPDAASSFEALW